MKRKVHIVSSMVGSIGEITTDLMENLKNNFEVTIEGKDAPEEIDILLCHFVNQAASKDSVFKKFKKRILIQPIDGTEIKQGIVIASFNAG